MPETALKSARYVDHLGVTVSLFPDECIIPMLRPGAWSMDARLFSRSALISIGLGGGEASLKGVRVISTIEGTDLDRSRDDFATKKQQNHGQKETANKATTRSTDYRWQEQKEVGLVSDVAVKLIGSTDLLSRRCGQTAGTPTPAYVSGQAPEEGGLAANSADDRGTKRRSGRTGEGVGDVLDNDEKVMFNDGVDTRSRRNKEKP